MEAGQTELQDRDNLIFNLFRAALSRPEAERDQFLRHACSADLELFTEVDRRLKWETRLNGFLEAPILSRDRADRPFAAGDLILDRFRILRVAGEGGMGVVYEAMDEKLGQRRALKCPRFEFRKRISPEAAKSLNVTHPNVCRVYEIYTVETNTGEIDFLTMEFLEGETLAVRLPKAPTGLLKTPEGLAIARQICAGLKAVHVQGIIHRDLKPGNIMLCNDTSGQPRAVLMDFGIAQSDEIFSSQVRGTPAYVAPELWKGDGAATGQSDLYALGVLLYQMASGRLPFPEETTWERRLKELPEAPGIGEPHRSAIMQCLQPDPLKRAANIDRIEASLTGRRSRRWLLAAVVAAATAGAVGVSSYVSRSYPRLPPEVRLAVLPPAMDGLEDVTDTAPLKGLANGFSARLKSLRGVQGQLFVFTATQTAEADATTVIKAKDILSATHIITCQMQREGTGWSIHAELIDARTGNTLEQWRTTAASEKEFSARFYDMEELVFRGTIRSLDFGAVPTRQSLTPECYLDFQLGLYYTRSENLNAAKAIAHFQKVIGAAPQSALGYAALAEAYLQLDNTNDARKAVAKAEQLDPDLPQMHYVRAIISTRTGSRQWALADLARASELNPRDAEFFIAMANAHYFMNELKEAEQDLERAIAAEPGYYKTYLMGGEFHFQQGRPGVAERFWLKAVTLAPGRLEARLNMAKAYLAEDRLADAKTRIDQCLRIRKTPKVLTYLGTYQERAGLIDQAIETYRDVIEMEPQAFKVYARLGSLYRRKAQMEKAASAFREGLRRTEKDMNSHPGDAGHIAWSALYYANLGDSPHTRERAERALEVARGIGGSKAATEHSKANVREPLILAYDRIGEGDRAEQMMAGASPDLLTELRRSPDVSDRLKKHVGIP